ncbi:MAG TPA: lmo0937 family membrane protein [Trueperaceae bacterium]|nr:lmo0937 family membrane protein [Trueperaceae bacterium]
MLVTIAVILGVLWLVGMLTSYTVGGLLHILLVVALILFIIRALSGRRVV